MFDISPAAWYLDLGIIAGALTSVGIIVKKGVVPMLRALWIAILAAPRIAEGAEQLVALLGGDVLERLDEGTKKFVANDQRLEEHRERLDSHTRVMQTHGERILSIEHRLHTHPAHVEHEFMIDVLNEPRVGS